MKRNSDVIIYKTEYRIFFVTALRVRRLVTHPTEPSWLISSVQGNNEIGMWNIESGSRQLVLWPSNAPPLSNTQV